MLMRERAVAATEPYDFLIAPTSPITAYNAEEATPGNDPDRPFEHIAFTVPFNMSEQPAASICAGYDGDGMPVGLQIIGHRFDDAGVLRMAAAWEAIRPRPQNGHSGSVMTLLLVVDQSRGFSQLFVVKENSSCVSAPGRLAPRWALPRSRQ
jgi:hypothetical protein